MWKEANCSPSRSTGEISATNSSAIPVIHSTSLLRAPRAPRPRRARPASADVDRDVRGQRDQDDRRERPARIDRNRRPQQNWHEHVAEL